MKIFLLLLLLSYCSFGYSSCGQLNQASCQSRQNCIWTDDKSLNQCTQFKCEGLSEKICEQMARSKTCIKKEIIKECTPNPIFCNDYTCNSDCSAHPTCEPKNLIDCSLFDSESIPCEERAPFCMQNTTYECTSIYQKDFQCIEGQQDCKYPCHFETQCIDFCSQVEVSQNECMKSGYCQWNLNTNKCQAKENCSTASSCNFMQGCFKQQICIKPDLSCDQFSISECQDQEFCKIANRCAQNPNYCNILDSSKCKFPQNENTECSLNLNCSNPSACDLNDCNEKFCFSTKQAVCEQYPVNDCSQRAFNQMMCLLNPSCVFSQGGYCSEIEVDEQTIE